MQEAKGLLLYVDYDGPTMQVNNFTIFVQDAGIAKAQGYVVTTKPGA